MWPWLLNAPTFARRAAIGIRPLSSIASAGARPVIRNADSSIPLSVRRVMHTSVAFQVQQAVKTLAATARVHKLRWVPSNISSMTPSDIKRLRKRQWRSFKKAFKRQLKEQAQQHAEQLSRRRQPSFASMTAVERGFTPDQYRAHKLAMRAKYYRPPPPRASGPRRLPPNPRLTRGELLRLRRSRISKRIMRKKLLALLGGVWTKRRPDPRHERDWRLVVGSNRAAMCAQSPVAPQHSLVSQSPELVGLYKPEQFVTLLPPEGSAAPIPVLVLLYAFVDVHQPMMASSVEHTKQSRQWYSSHAIISLYHAAKRIHPDLFARRSNPDVSTISTSTRHLSARNFSFIIALFGSLSLISSPSESRTIPRAFRPGAALLSQMISNAYSTEHWKFVAAVARDKQSAGHPLDVVDRYWLMRMELATAEHIMQLQASPRSASTLFRTIERASSYYQSICSKSIDPLVHGDFLRIVAASGVPKSVNRTTKAVVRLVQRSHGLEPDLQCAFWEVLARTQQSDPSDERDELLDILFQNVQDIQQRRVPTGDLKLARRPARVVDKNGRVFTDLSLPSLEEACDALGHAFLAPTLPPLIHDPPRLQLRQWAKDEAVTALRDKLAAWDFLVHLAMASTTVRCQISQLPQLAQSFDEMRWPVVAQLVSLGRAFDHDLSKINITAGQRRLDLVASRWLQLAAGQSATWVDRAIFLALFRMSGQFQHPTLLPTLVAIVRSSRGQAFLHPHHDFVRSGPLGDSGHPGAALEYAMALLVLHRKSGASIPVGTIWQQLQERLREAGLVTRDSSKAFANFANQLLRHLLRLKCREEASLLYRDLSRGSPGCASVPPTPALKLADQTRVEMIQSFVDDLSSLPLAIDILGERMDQLPRTKAHAMLVALSRGLYLPRVMRLEQQHAAVLCTVMQQAGYALRVEHGTREHAHWRWMMRICARSGQHDAVVEVVLDHVRIPKTSTSWTNTQCRFLMALAGDLLRQRQFRAAAKLLHGIPHGLPDTRRRLANLVISQLSRASASNLAYQSDRVVNACTIVPTGSAVGTRPSGQTDAEVRRLVGRGASFNALRPNRKAALPSRRLFGRPNLRRPELVFRSALQLLVKGDRSTAAHRFFAAARTDNRLTERDRTDLGNILLTTRLHPRRKNRIFRQVRGVFVLLDEMRAGGDWQPDRVTLNILLKAIVQWDLVVDAQRLRTLFNAILRLGYPGEPLPTAEQHHATTFDAANNFRLGRMARVISPHTPLNFRRHVRPLYKTFILAFRARGDRQAEQLLITQLALVRDAHELAERGRFIRATQMRAYRRKMLDRTK